MIHTSRGGRVTSSPMIHGITTSEFGRPFGFVGSASHPRARSPGLSNAPDFTSPTNPMPASSARRVASAKLAPDIGEAGPTAELGDALLERVALAGRVGLSRRLNAGDPTQVTVVRDV